MEKILIGVITAALGFLGGLLTPWIKWQVEKHQSRHSSREKLISDGREKICSLPDTDTQFLQTIEYSRLRVYLPRDLVNRLESDIWAAYANPARPTTRKSELLDALSNLERDWKLK